MAKDTTTSGLSFRDNNCSMNALDDDMSMYVDTVGLCDTVGRFSSRAFFT